MRVDDQNPSSNILAPLVAGVLGVLILGTTIEIVQRAASLGPKVGDMVAYNGERDVSSDPGMRLDVTRADGKACVVDLATLRRGKGSLVVEERHPAPGRSYRVHWSGGPTSAGETNCGDGVDLTLKNDSLAAMAMAAGGYGLQRRHFVVTTPWSQARAEVP
jgi:hypothetical protein